ncbi:MAG: carboxy-S-adenosyl-L-methionine synthase CmoA [Bacteriovoracaceae bacterium]|nr:carboxy-S-adenosyl-L-methionine synthase CmoA [Bacteriovoracaceae bacterium]
MDASKKDQYFAQPMDKVTPFSFNAEVAEVFDDMVKRSVPLYRENQQLTVDLLSRLLKKGDTVYDLGCSTGTVLHLIGNALKPMDLKLIGLDASAPMVEKARLKMKAFGHKNAEIDKADITRAEFEPCGAVIMNYTLQFLPVETRLPLLKKIFKALRPGGVLILAEKIQTDSPGLQDLVTQTYYDFKGQNGYSELEISQKREALENVLIPLTPSEQNQLLQEAGFGPVEMLLRWGPFATFLAVKA